LNLELRQKKMGQRLTLDFNKHEARLRRAGMERGAWSKEHEARSRELNFMGHRKVNPK